MYPQLAPAFLLTLSLREVHGVLCPVPALLEVSVPWRKGTVPHATRLHKVQTNLLLGLLSCLHDEASDEGTAAVKHPQHEVHHCGSELASCHVWVTMRMHHFAFSCLCPGLGSLGCLGLSRVSAHSGHSWAPWFRPKLTSSELVCFVLGQGASLLKSMRCRSAG